MLRTTASYQISAALNKFQSRKVYILITFDSLFYGINRFGKSGGIEYNDAEFSVFFFVLIPTSVVGAFSWLIKNNIVLNLMEGLLRITILILYMLGISKFEDIKRTFMYHGAEHKVIYCYENDLELTVENAKKFGTLHPRCGTNFLFLVMATSIILFSFFGWPNIIARIIMRILCIPIVAGISYEIIKFLGKYDNILSKIVAYPGMMLQHITTNEPDDEQLEVAIKALKAVI